MGVPGIVAGCFGKLPVSADFIDIQASTPEASAFDRWLRDGVGEAHARADGWEAAFTAAPAQRFIYWSETPERVLSGVLVPSRDASGRLFPFTAFFSVDGRRADARAARLVAFASSVPGDSWTDAADRADLERRIAELAPPEPREDFGEFVQGTTAADLAAAYPTEAGVSLVARVAINALAVAGDLVARPGASPAFALRLPLPGPEGAPAETVSFWLALLAAAVPRAPHPPVAFWAASADRGWNRLLCFFQPPSRQRFPFVFDPAIRSDSLYPVAEEAVSWRTPPRDAIAAGAVARLGDASVSLKEVLELTALLAGRTGRA